jgi:hypothetical protein
MTGSGDPAFFGYGSLVNRATHDYAVAAPATIGGWRRVWRHTRLRPFAFLSVEPARAEIDGLIAQVPGGDWAALDTREAAYQRHKVVEGAVANPPDWAGHVEIYAIDPGHAEPHARHPILLSYLDAVVQGFLREFGAEGVTRFFTTTRGWTALHDDRDAPIYTRHQMLSPTERALVDAACDTHGLRRAARP